MINYIRFQPQFSRTQYTPGDLKLNFSTVKDPQNRFRDVDLTPLAPIFSEILQSLDDGSTSFYLNYESHSKFIRFI